MFTHQHGVSESSDRKSKHSGLQDAILRACVYMCVRMWGGLEGHHHYLWLHGFLDFHKNSTARNGVKKDRKLFTTAK